MKSGNRQPREPKPVEEIELSSSHTKLKIVLLIVVLVIAVGAFTFGIISCLSAKSGWNMVVSSASLDCSDEFEFYYYLERGGLSGRNELKSVSATYTSACVDAYKIFNADARFDDSNNLAYVNAKVGEAVRVDPALYSAFELIDQFDSRLPYLGPIYSYYSAAFYSSTDDEAKGYLPGVDPEIDAFFDTVASFANDPQAISLELLGDNTVRLNVCEEYRRFALDNQIVAFVDLFPVKNAFIADFIVERLVSSGCSVGSVSSYDGFMRTLDNSDVSLSAAVYDKTDKVYYAADMSITGGFSMARFRDYPISGSDYGYYYVFEDGTAVNKYIDPATGLNKSCMRGLTVYSYEKSCARVALEAYPIYVADAFDDSAPAALKENGMFCVFCKDNTVMYSDPGLTVFNLLNRDVTYTSALIE